MPSRKMRRKDNVKIGGEFDRLTLHFLHTLLITPLDETSVVKSE